MKKTFLLLTAVLLCAASCKKTAETPFQTPDAEKSMAQLSVNIGIPQEETKVLANTDNVKDFRINSVQLFVFNNADGSGEMETDYYYTPDSPANETVSVNLNITSGQKIIYAVVNRDRMYCERGAFFTVEDFEEELADLRENSFSGLLMLGKNEVDVLPLDKNANPDQEAQETAIYVRRLVAMVKLSSVTVDFSQSSLAGASFKITGIYLKNAVGRVRLALSGNTDEPGLTNPVSLLPLAAAQYANVSYWYNPMKPVSGCPAVMTDNDIQDVCNTAGTATPIGRCLLTYPNGTSTDSFSSTWSVRRTRLTIKARVSLDNVIEVNEDTYYTFTLPQLAANKVYNIQNIHITQMGRADDNTDTVLTVGQVSPTITVDDWDSDVINLNYEF